MQNAKLGHENLEDRVKRLEEIAQINELKSKYCFSMDDHDWETLFPLFTRTASLDFGSFGKPSGERAIQEHFKSTLPNRFSLMMHNVHNPMIEVNGDRARGRWYFEVTLTEAPSGQILSLAGKYDDQLVRENGEWKFESIKVVWFKKKSETFINLA